MSEAVRTSRQVLLVGGALLVGAQLGGQRRVGGDHHEGGAEEGVRARGVDPQRLRAALDREVDVRSLGATDPVALRRDHAGGPRGLEPVQLVEQLLGVLGDPEVPLGQLALGHRRAAALALAVDDLLVGQHGLVPGAPVDRAVLAVGQAPLAELPEQPLRPAVVLGVGGVQPARPVEGEPVVLHRGGLGLDVGVGVLRGVRVVADRRVLRGQPEGVPADRVEHLVAAEAPVAGDHVVQGEHLGVTHVQVAGGVGKHRQRVALLPLAGGHHGVVGGEGRQVLPPGLPLLLDRAHVVRRGVRLTGTGRLVSHSLGLLLVVAGGCCPVLARHEKTPRQGGVAARLPAGRGQRGCRRSSIVERTPSS